MFQTLLSHSKTNFIIQLFISQSNCQLSAISYQLSAISYQLSAVKFNIIKALKS
ncbi:MAG: hypothetical protein F6K44_24635 [Moorea sp. SIO3E2]|nr:hypothetical protein [Moorena sp. SIO3E2]